MLCQLQNFFQRGFLVWIGLMVNNWRPRVEEFLVHPPPLPLLSDVPAARSHLEEAWPDSPPPSPSRPGQEPKEKNIQLFASVGLDFCLLVPAFAGFFYCIHQYCEVGFGSEKLEPAKYISTYTSGMPHCLSISVFLPVLWIRNYFRIYADPDPTYIN